MTYAELAAVFRLVAGHIDNLGAVPQPSEPPTNPIPPSSPEVPVVAPAPPPSLPVGFAPEPPAASGPKATLAPEVPKPVIDLDTIKGIQQAFNSIRPANFAKLEEDGVDDKVFAWALKEFQATVGIPVTGKPDETTINALHKAIFGTSRT